MWWMVIWLMVALIAAILGSAGFAVFALIMAFIGWIIAGIAALYLGILVMVAHNKER